MKNFQTTNFFHLTFLLSILNVHNYIALVLCNFKFIPAMCKFMVETVNGTSCFLRQMCLIVPTEILSLMHINQSWQ
jgi:hypothetical protein